MSKLPSALRSHRGVGGETVDVAVIGGGPAGAAAATLLARWGFEVVVLTKAVTDAPTLAESLPPSVTKPLLATGLARAVDQAGFLRTYGNTVWWGEEGRAGRSEPFAGGRYGYQVLRRPFDALLLGQAEAAGAVVRRGTVVRDVDPETEPVRIESVTGDGERQVTRARVVLDCSGRSGVVARHGRRRDDEGLSTLALIGVWRREGGWGLPDESHTLVESFDDGWAWSVPVSVADRHVAVMVDPRSTTLERTSAIEPSYRRQLDKTRHLRERLRGARLIGPAWVRSASPYTAPRAAGRRFLLVGDAASFVDPLSSFGVKKALSSAWLAAVVTRTWLRRTDMETAARELFDIREAEMVARSRRVAATFFADVAGRRPHPFWLDRAGMVGEEVAAADVDTLRRDPEVVAAFESLRRASSLDLRRTPDVVVETHPTVIDDVVALEPRLAGPAWPANRGGIRYVRGVDLPRLVEVATTHRHVPDMFEAYQRGQAAVPLADFLGALSVLVGKGMLRNVTG